MNMRVVSWNINGIRAAVKKGLCEHLRNFDADIIGFQETKAQVHQVAEACKDITGYHRYASSAVRPGYSGVSVLSKREATNVVSELGVERFDVEGRMLALYFDDLLVVNVYFPNGAGKNGDNSRVPYKLEFYDALFDFVDGHRGPKIVMGDFNIAHNEIDLARPKENKNISGFLPEERDHFTKVLKRGYVDTFRHFDQSPHQYTWWNMRFGARARNIGWRIDTVLASTDTMPIIKNAFIWQDVMGSDHCPVGVELVTP